MPLSDLRWGGGEELDRGRPLQGGEDGKVRSWEDKNVRTTFRILYILEEPTLLFGFGH